MSERNFLAQDNLFAVSLARETALNTEQSLTASMLMQLSNIPMQLEPRSEDNSDEAHGKEEPDTIYRMGNLASGSYSNKRAQAQHFGMFLSFGLGVCTPSAWGAGYKNVITPLKSNALPAFTSALQLSDVLKRRFASNFVDSVKATFAKDSWASIDAALKATGKYTDNVVKETITAAYNATSLAMAANAVQGSTAAARLSNVQQIRCVVPSTGERVEVVYSAVSAATPAIITISAPGGVATSTSYEVLYIPAETAWCTFPARVTEPPLRVQDLTFKLGGKWNGSAFLGGKTLSDDISSIEYNLNNNMRIEHRPGAGTGVDYANYAKRDGRVQTLALNHEMRDFMLNQRMIDKEYFGVYLKATGDEFETGKNYYVEGVFPRCAVLKNPISVDGKVLAEAGDIRILEDDTYGSCIWTAANLQNGYAQ